MKHILSPEKEIHLKKGVLIFHIHYRYPVYSILCIPVQQLLNNIHRLDRLAVLYLIGQRSRFSVYTHSFFYFVPSFSPIHPFL